MKSTSIVVASLLATVALAQPHRHHARHHKKRDLDVVWVTEYEYVTDVVGVTTTIWVSSGFVPPTTSATSEASTTSGTAAQFFQGASEATTSSTYVPLAPVATSSTSSSSVAPVVETPTPATTSTPVYSAPTVESSSSPAEVFTPEAVTTSSTPVYSAPAENPSTTAAAPAATTSASSSSSGTTSGSTTGTCIGSSDACEGDITYYEAGLGACGITSDGTTENVVALPYEFMGTQSNGNPYCGKTITITCIATGQQTTATVVDKCMGCTGRSIDLSTKAFSELDSNYLTVGRTTATWYFND